MTSLRIMHLSVLFSLVALAPALASAQEPAHILQDLQSSLHINDTVRVEETNGNSVQGQVESISASSLKLRVKGAPHEFREPQILEIKQKYHDSIINGLRTGAVIGGVAGAVVGAASDSFGDGFTRGGQALLLGAFGAGVGAGSGALGDWLMKSYRTVFSMPRTTDIGFNVSAILSRETKGMLVAFRF